MKQGDSKTINLILGGGGASAYVHSGILKTLDENEYNVKSIIGLSMGGIIGWLYALNGNFSEAERYARDFNVNYKRFVKAEYGLLRLDVWALKNYLISLSGGKDLTFEELKIPLAIVATNINKRRIEFIRTGSVIDAIIATSIIPVLNKPYQLGDDHYIDGAKIQDVLKGIPKTFKNDAPYIVIEIVPRKGSFSSILNLSPVLTKRLVFNYYRGFFRRENTPLNDELVDINDRYIIRASPGNIRFHDFHKTFEGIKLGEEILLQHLSEIRNFLDRGKNKVKI